MRDDGTVMWQQMFPRTMPTIGFNKAYKCIDHVCANLSIDVEADDEMAE